LSSSSAVYVDSCVLLSLLIGDSGYAAAETWLCSQEDRPLWISHWVLLEIAGVIALNQRRRDLSPQEAEAMRQTFTQFRQERLSLIEPRAADFLQAQEWLQRPDQLPLRSGNALHLAMAKRHALSLCSADRTLVNAGRNLGVPCLFLG
jgi:predicted nucleic acid-binding protein